MVKRDFRAGRFLGAAALILTASTGVGFVPAALADAPPGYYDSVDATDGTTLRATLYTVIGSHTKIPYTSSSTDTWNVLELADEDPNDSSRIIDVYKNRTYPKYGAGNNDYDREHTWPKSYGFPDDESSNFPYSDCHMLFLCDRSYNSSRSNNVYNDCDAACVTYAADNYNGQVGVNYRKSESPIGRWQTWDGRKGDVARAVLYADLRYAGVGNDPDLILTDNISLIQTTGINADVAYMGMLGTLIQWHLADPPDAREMNRNDVVYSYQGNRNPFIDHPEWVELIHLGYISGAPIEVPGWNGPTATIASIHPNPFNPATNISFNLSRPGPVRLEIFALNGRRVRVLLNDDRTAGDHEVRWEGMDDRGGLVASGAYFCRISGADGADTQPLLLLK